MNTKVAKEAKEMVVLSGLGDLLFRFFWFAGEARVAYC